MMSKTVSFLVGMVAGAAALAATAWLTDKVSRKNEESDEDDFPLELTDSAENEKISEGAPPSDSHVGEEAEADAASPVPSETVADEAVSEGQKTQGKVGSGTPYFTSSPIFGMRVPLPMLPIIMGDPCIAPAHRSSPTQGS